MQVNGSKNDGTMNKTHQKMQKLIQDKKELHTIKTIIADGKVTADEAKLVGLNGEYDVSTEEGLEKFYENIRRIKELKGLQNEIKESPPKFGLE